MKRIGNQRYIRGVHTNPNLSESHAHLNMYHQCYSLSALSICPPPPPIIDWIQYFNLFTVKAEGRVTSSNVSVFHYAINQTYD